MITSAKQYAAAEKQLALLEESLKAPRKKGVPAVIEKAGKAQTRELMNEIKSEIAEYDKLQNGKLSDIKISTIDELMTAPIRYRIAKKMSVDEFGREVGISARQIARYEKAQYKNISNASFMAIIEKIDVKITGKVVPKKKGSKAA